MTHAAVLTRFGPHIFTPRAGVRVRVSDAQCQVVNSLDVGSALFWIYLQIRESDLPILLLFYHLVVQQQQQQQDKHRCTVQWQVEPLPLAAGTANQNLPFVVELQPQV